jgi:hypothetical protein
MLQICFSFRNNITSGCPFQVGSKNLTFPYMFHNKILFGATNVSRINAITTNLKLKILVLNTLV